MKNIININESFVPISKEKFLKGVGNADDIESNFFKRVALNKEEILLMNKINNITMSSKKEYYFSFEMEKKLFGYNSNNLIKTLILDKPIYYLILGCSQIFTRKFSMIYLQCSTIKHVIDTINKSYPSEYWKEFFDIKMKFDNFNELDKNFFEKILKDNQIVAFGRDKHKIIFSMDLDGKRYNSFLTKYEDEYFRFRNSDNIDILIDGYDGLRKFINYLDCGIKFILND